MESESIKLSQLEVFVAVAECGNFSAAVLDLQRSQVAASRALALLENQRMKTGTVRIATFRSVATHLLPLAIKQFNQAFPEIKVLVQEASYTATIENNLRQVRADIGIMPLPMAEDIQTWALHNWGMK